MSYLYDTLEIQWKKWLPADTNTTTIKHGAFYSAKMGDLRIISLNGNYCSTRNPLLLLNSTDPQGQLEWLVKELEDSVMNHQKVHILNHIPPGGLDCLRTWSRNFYDIVNR